MHTHNNKKQIKLICFILLLFASSNAFSFEWKQYFDKENFKEKIREELIDQDIHFSTSLMDLDLAEGVGLSSKYKYEVEASYLSSFYTRYDQWQVSFDITAGDVFDTMKGKPFSFNISRGSEVFFARQFPSKKEAVNALPYTLRNLPLDSERALNHFQVGDFVSIPTKLNVAFGVGFSTSTTGGILPLDASVSGFYVISGEFLMQVFKLDQTHVRLKLIANKNDSLGAGANAKVGFDLFGVDVLNRQLNRIFDTTLLDANGNEVDGAQFIVDYVFDLSNKEAADAYDSIMQSNFKFKEFKMVDKISRAAKLKDKLITVYFDAEKIFNEDLDKPVKRVERIFKGFNDYNGDSKKFKIGVMVASYGRNWNYTYNRVGYIDPHEATLEFDHPVYNQFSNTTVGIRWFRYQDNTSKDLFGLIPKIEQEDSFHHPDIGLNYDRIDKYYNSIEQTLVRQYFSDQIPDKIYRQIPWEEWNQYGDKKDANIHFELILKHDAFEQLKNYTQEELEKKVWAFYKSRKNPSKNTANGLWNKFKELLLINSLTDDFQLKRLSSKLYEALVVSAENGHEQLKQLMDLRENAVFRHFGVGLLMYLLNQDTLQDNVYMKLQMNAKELTPLDIKYGKLEYPELYDQLYFIRNKINGRQIDLRIKDTDRQLEIKR